MIIVQTPLRVSFFGGGTDFAGYYREEGGCVLSASIDKYIFVTIKRRFDQKLRVGWTKTEMVDSVDEISHELIRESLRLTQMKSGLEITTMGDIPSDGSGLGSSSTVTVGALHAMYSLQSELVPAERLASEACHIEIDVLGRPIGVQDQYIAAYGGLRFIEFNQDGSIVADRLPVTSQVLKQINQNTMLFFTGLTRSSQTILTEQRENIVDRQTVLGQLKKMAHNARDALLQGEVDVLGEMLHASWQLKKRLASKISNPAIDDMYSRALSAGAIGGKISGAGGGGFLLLYCRPENQAAVRNAMSAYQELPFAIEPDGSKVIFNYRR